MNKDGLKYDKGKLRWDLVPFEQLEQIVEVYTFGAKKYEANNWKKVKNARGRYLSALFRHLIAYCKGEMYDDETKYKHLAHAGWNVLALMYFEDKKKKNRRK
jgi:hypothetical protein